MQVIRAELPDPDQWLHMNAALAADWLVAFLQDEAIRKRRVTRVVIGLSGGVDSAVTTFLAARAFGPENVHVFRMPYRLSSQASLDHADLVVDELGLPSRTIPITGMADGYLCESEPDADGTRIGNICARCRAVILFDQSAKIGGLPLGTGNKTERFFGYYTWHADDSPPINPLGDLYKTQVWKLARELGVPEPIIAKPPTADLVKGQTDEADFGISYARADQILSRHVAGLSRARIIRDGFDPADVDLVIARVARTHWKRRLPTTAMLSDTAINEYYLRPVDYLAIPQSPESTR
ncbi:MAG: NAD+ synthase [Fimbriimonadaceae bacterium]|nr:NAD+ synthase [Fimbriimonadaceae bacterium]